jgi:regulatory protein
MTEDRRQNISIATKTSLQKAMNTAVRILTQRDHSTYELKQKLKQRGIPREVIDPVIFKCTRLNYIDDKRTAQAYISELKTKCFGKRHIRSALKKKGLAGAAIEKILLENCPEAEERANASRLLKKKIKMFNREEDTNRRRDKIYRFLYSRTRYQNSKYQTGH